MSRTTHVVISIPRLLIASALIGLVIGGSQFVRQPSQTQPLRVQVTSAKSNDTPYTAAPQAVAQPAPTPTPPSSVVAPKPVSASVRATQSTAPAPVVTPAPSASVSSLTPTDPTPAPPTPPTGSGTPAPDTGTPVTSGYTSTNWSGYLATTGTYSGVSGSWTVPKATGVVGRTSADTAWVGIGGVSSDDLIQVGTDNTVSPSGVQTSSAFYELLPSAAKTITSLSISPGDNVTASLAEISSGQWTVSIADTTTGQSFTTTVAYSSTHSSAEWIEEDPSTLHRHLVPFDTFAPVAFTEATATSSGSSLTVKTSNAQPITMVVSGGSAVATPTILGSDGESFTVNRNS